MKLIQAMKQVKLNDEKIVDLQRKIAENSAYVSIATPPYDDPKEKVRGWIQSCEDLTRQNCRLLIAIQRTNLETTVSIDLGEGPVEKSIAEWIWRRRKYADTDMNTWAQLTDRNIQEGKAQAPGGEVDVRIIRNYDPEQRDAKREVYRAEPGLIDANLEVVNATTDLIGADGTPF